MQELSTTGEAATAFTLTERAATAASPLGCWIAAPLMKSAEAAPIVAVHGIGRGSRVMAEKLAPFAALTGRTVIAPHFCKRRWKNYQQPGNGARPDEALLALMTELRALGVHDADAFDLFGFSGGAQFAHRFAMVSPQPVRTLCVAAAGWYTFPDSATYPYGLQPSGKGQADLSKAMARSLDRFLSMPVLVVVGEFDAYRDAGFRRGACVDLQQGRTRIERARRWAAAFDEAATSREIKARINIEILRGGTHDVIDCLDSGLAKRVVDFSAPSGAADEAPARAMML